MEMTVVMGFVGALVVGSLPLLLTHLLARGDREATAEQRFQASIATALTRCQEELGEAQARENEWREKYFTERDQRLPAVETTEATEVKPPPPAGG